MQTEQPQIYNTHHKTSHTGQGPGWVHTGNPVLRQLREKDTPVEASKVRPYLKNKISQVCHLVGRVPS